MYARFIAWLIRPGIDFLRREHDEQIEQRIVDAAAYAWLSEELTNAATSSDVNQKRYVVIVAALLASAENMTSILIPGTDNAGKRPIESAISE